MTILTDNECREIYNSAMAMPERSVVQTMRVIEAAVLAKHGAWGAAIAWVVRERNSASPMQSFENSLTAAQETKARWANDGYEGDIVELYERVNAKLSGAEGVRS